MTIYHIDFSDPLRTGFSINPGEFNGPGGTGTAKTSLRLYGRGSLEWGESVDENLVRLAEHFAGATPPRIPVAGQLWFKQVLYVKVASAFYQRNVNAGTWELISVTTIPGTIGSQPAGTIGQHVYSTADNKLYRWDSAYKQEGATWLTREFSLQATVPTTQAPVQTLLVYDENTQRWVSAATTSTGSGLPVDGDFAGQFYVDIDTGIVYVWNSVDSSWKPFLGPANTAGAPVGGWTTTSESNIDMQNYRIINIPTPLSTNLTYAANVGYVNTTVNSAIAALSSSVSGAYVPLVGGASMTGAYNVTGSLSATTTVTAGTLSATTAGVTGTATIGTVNATSLTSTSGTITTLTATNSTITNSTITNLTLGGAMNANSQRLLNVASPLVGSDGANATYVQTTADTTTRTIASVVNPGSPKNGDIDVASGVVYVRVSGVWRQVWPPLYQ